MSALAHAGYAQTRKVTANPRQIEAQLFAQIAAELELASSEGNGSKTALAAAVHRNNQLWNALLTDLANPENGLGAELRAQLISLGTFSVRHGSKVLAGDAAAKSLIDINRALSAGLRAATAQAA